MLYILTANNVQKYYKDYRKAKTAEEKLRRECTINALKAFPALSSEEADALFSDMNADMLQKFSSAFEGSLGGAPQLTGEKDKDRERDFGSFKI